MAIIKDEAFFAFLELFVESALDTADMEDSGVVFVESLEENACSFGILEFFEWFLVMDFQEVLF